MTFRAVFFPRLDEAAAFVAALARHLNYPQGESQREASVEIWSRPEGDGVCLWLSDPAVSAATTAFGAAPDFTPRGELPTRDAVLVLRGDRVTPMGIEEAVRRLRSAIERGG